MQSSNAGEHHPPRPWTSEQAWQATAERIRQCVLFFDFDGTLAPVGDDPSVVQPAPKTLTAIHTLAKIVQRVVIVSARPVDFLRDRLARIDQVDLYGLYGLERCRDHGETITEKDALPWVPTMAELAEQASTELPDGAMVEYKRLSVALHYRTAPHLADAIEAWGRDRAAALGLRVQVGRMVLELKPPVDRDKGMVIGEALGSARCAWYFGDDVSDIKAFAALRARERSDSGFFGVCVAVANPETGQEVSTAADLTVDSPEALGDFLAAAADRLS